MHLQILSGYTNFYSVKFYDTRTTLEKIKGIIQTKEKGAYFRFGDGDVHMCVGLNAGWQRGNAKISLEMTETFLLEHKNIIKTLPLHCIGNGEDSEKMCAGMRFSENRCLRVLRLAQKIYDFESVYSPWILPFFAVYEPDVCIEFLKFLKKNNCALLIGNKNIPRSLINLLFGNNCQFVKTPPRNAYSAIDRIEREALNKIKKDTEYKIIITSMGVSGRPLQKRLWAKLDNVFLFDFGSLMDALCGLRTRQWIGKSKFNRKKFIKKLKNYTSENH